MPVYTYCSFADDTKFLGALLLKGNFSIDKVSRMAHAMKLNPGGSMAGYPLNIEDKEESTIAKYTGKLLQIPDLKQMNQEMSEKFGVEGGFKNAKGENIDL